MKFIYLFLFLPVVINAQIIEGISTLGLSQFPNTTLKMSGYSSRGFNDDYNKYNPKFNFDDSTIVVSISGLMNIGQAIYTTYIDEEIKYLENKLVFLPEANIKIKVGENKNVQISVSYFSDVLSSLKFSDNSGSTSLIFRTTSGVYQIQVTNDSYFQSISRILQASFSYLFAESSSLSLCIRTTSFDQIYHWVPLDPFQYKTNLFDNAQLLFSVNHKFNHQSAVYFVFKSQNSRIEMQKDAYYNGEEVLLPDSYLSLHGNIGYGFQHKLFNIIKLSAEISHQFLEENTDLKEDYSTTHIEHHIWNNEIIFGLDVELFEFLDLGLNISKYWKYDNNIYLRKTSETGPDDYIDVGPSKPLTIIAGMTYSLLNYKIGLIYQHSEVEYNFSEDPDIEILRQDYGNYLKLAISAGF